jgi:hypothetical protein
MGISSISARRCGILVLVGLLGLAVTFAATSASGASSGSAVVAKKKHKCKHKKGKKSAAAAKKKKCKKKKPTVAPPVTTQTTPTPPSGPVVRAEVRWTVANPTDEADIDLHAWFNGEHTGYSEPDSGDVFEIPNLVHLSDNDAPGLERITDQTNPSTRPLTFTICSYWFDTADQAEVTYHFVFADGTTQDGTTTMIPGQIKFIGPEEGGSVSKSTTLWCPPPPP